MVQATPTELQSSETYKLSQFWEGKATDKTNIQQMVLKINLAEDAMSGMQQDASMTLPNKAGGPTIGYED